MAQNPNNPVPMVTSNLQLLSNGNTDGTVFGPALDSNGNPAKEAFYGGTPVVRRSGSNQAAVGQTGSGSGTVFTYASSQSPTSVLTITSTEKAMTVTGILTTDYPIINKPTSQAGLGVGNVRVSAANTLGVTFTNFTAATITPTASEVYGIVALRGLTTMAAVLSPAAVPANTTAEQQFTVTGVSPGMIVDVIKPTAQAGLDIAGVRVVGNNTVGVNFVNVSAATITPTASESYTFFSANGINVNEGNLLTVKASATPGGIAMNTTAEVAVTVTGLATTDVIVGVSKPTAQAGLGVVGWRVSAANTMGLTFVNATGGTLTPTAGELYAVTINRASPSATLAILTSTLSPASVAANTTAEQTFTVTGLVASSPVWVNKPSAQPGLGIMGVRVSAANTLAINFSNSTAAAITPTASEIYIVANFQVPIPDSGNNVSQPVSGNGAGAVSLTNEIRAVLVGLNLMAGS